MLIIVKRVHTGYDVEIAPRLYRKQICIRISIKFLRNINYRGARQIAWLRFQTLLRIALAARVSAIWIRDNET